MFALSIVTGYCEGMSVLVYIYRINPFDLLGRFYLRNPCLDFARLFTYRCIGTG